MVERERDVFQEPRERVRILNDNLADRDSDCNIGLMGVIHDGVPGEDITGRLQDADVVTLELTRGVVKAGLRSEDSRILTRNEFWRTVVDTLRASDGEKKTVKGIEVNQTPRVAWKRFSLHYGISDLASSALTIEIEKDLLHYLSRLLSEEELDNLRRYNWLITRDPHTYCGQVNFLNRHLIRLRMKIKDVLLS